MEQQPRTGQTSNNELQHGTITWPPIGYADNVQEYLQKAEEDSVLRPHQREVFEDVARFFEAGDTRGYINLPTGTGKTVLFVELSKALHEGNDDEHKPRILVVTPTRDLVHQTLGRTGEKGFGRFAPDLRIGSYFSDSSEKEKRELDSYDVVVTTYRSFGILSNQYQFRPITEEEQAQLPMLIKGIKNVPSGAKALDKFGVIILDEAHHALGDNAQQIISNLSPDTVLIGFTATPDIDDNTRLTNVLPSKIHELELNEAISMGLLAPIVPIGIRSGVQVRGSDIYDENGEFIDSRIRYLAEDLKRNQRIMDAAKALAEQEVGTIISCIAGGEAWQARYLAEQLNAIGVKAASVHNKVPAEERQRIYQQFSNGEIDVLTFVGVLGEGWDSPRAKGLINARPTRSNIFSKQRLGRITRPGATAFTIDIYDDFDGQNLPITVADVINEGSIEFGSSVGTSEDEAKVQSVLAALRLAAGDKLMGSLEDVYREQAGLIAGLEKLHKGQLLDSTGIPAYATSTALNRSYHGLTDEVVAKYEEMHDTQIPKKVAAQGKSVRTVYSVKEASSMLYDIPRADPDRYFIDGDKEKWVAPQGIVQLFSKRYPNVNAGVIAETLELVGENLDWIPTKYTTASDEATYRQYYVIKMYRVSDETIKLLSEALAEYYSQDEGGLTN